VRSRRPVAVAGKAAWRASRRPKTSVTSLRATWVATSRSAGAWNVPTFSVRDWRRATEETDGANGSWTWQTSSAVESSSSSTVRATSIGTAGRPRPEPDPVGPSSASPTARTRTSPGAPSTSPARIALRAARTAASSREGATITTRWPRCASSSLSLPTYVLTSCRSSHGYGVTWAIARGSTAPA
jgi:hypothetical protein